MTSGRGEKAVTGNRGAAFHNRRQRVSVEGGTAVDIAVLVRWIVVFLVIFVLLMFLVFSLVRKSIR